MLVIVDTILPGKRIEVQWRVFLRQLFYMIASKSSKHQVNIFVEAPFPPLDPPLPNYLERAVGKDLRHVLFKLLIKRNPVAAFNKAMKPDLFIGFPASTYPSHGKKIMIIPSTAQIKKFSRDSSRVLVCVGSAVKTQLNEALASRVQVMPLVLPQHYRRLSLDELRAVQKQFSRLTDYFLFCTDDFNSKGLVQFLKAYSRFKKYQRSNTQLVLLYDIYYRSSINEVLAQYKFRDDVLCYELAEVEPAIGSLIAAAGAFLYHPSPSSPGLWPLMANAAGVPVLRVQDTIGTEGIALQEVERIGDWLISIYKDDAMRERVIAEGLAKAEAHDANQNLAPWLNLLGI